MRKLTDLEIVLTITITTILAFLYFKDVCAISKEQPPIVCIDCIQGYIGGGCGYIDENGNAVEPERCSPYDMSKVKHACPNDTRGAVACIEIYQPVCGDDAKTYPNSCFACIRHNVEFYFDGDCLEVLIDEEKYCRADNDCACGVNINTGVCFYGNRRFVDVSQQCPDFCGGIAGNLAIKCSKNVCIQTT